MSEFPRVKVINETADLWKTKCYINDQQIDKVVSVNFHIEPNEIPTFDFEMFGIPEIDIPGDVRFSFTPQTVDEAVKILRNELLKHGDIYNGFRDSIQSVLKPKERYIGDGEFSIRVEFGSSYLAEEILKRIMGEE